ncbi:hypothetical protein LEP1GSC021_1461 [Leptospira noguchii str. 1993005606]|nr:hypothetical protein LEP1GSC021_1461 [Leptospira noguchii str. 1993005606]
MSLNWIVHFSMNIKLSVGNTTLEFFTSDSLELEIQKLKVIL